MALLLAEKVIIKTKYLDFIKVFLEKSPNRLLEQIKLNKYAIKLEKNKQPSYKLIYSLGSIELKTLKTYIKTNLANAFIQALKLPAGAPILFVRKPNSNFCLYVNYQGLNNPTIKNWYLLLLIDKSLNVMPRSQDLESHDLLTSSIY